MPSADVHSDAATMSQRNIGASQFLQAVPLQSKPRTRLVFAETGGALDDALTKPVARGATQKRFVSPERARKATDKTRKVKARVRANERTGQTKEKTQASVIILARPAAQHPVDVVRQLAAGRCPRALEGMLNVHQRGVHQESR